MSCCYSCARDGDPAARASIVDHLKPRITKLAVYYARRTGEDADDLQQEAWCGLLEALPELDVRIGSPEQHLLKRARWRMLDAVRRARVRRCRPLPHEEMLVVEAGTDRIIGDRVTEEFALTLKSTQQNILRCLMGGMTWRETGDALGFTSANVAYHVRQIRRQYEDWAGEDAAMRA
jgi:RNA polymerase sigma-70 factor (ECF subfamily)